MKRTLFSTLVITSTLGLSANVFALGMGELELKSTLNQPLKAEIELTNIEDLTEWEIKPSLASDGDFDRAGVEKLFFLSDIDFEVKGNRIILTSDKSVTEPFLNFLVQVNWPSGRVLREYTLLLDPPLFDEAIQPLAPIAVPENVQATKVEAQQAAAVQKKSRWETEAAQPGTYKVQPNDTLWEIAINTRPNRKVTPQQMMLAIQDSNPGAFIAGNINRLKTHQVLRIPNEQQMAARNDGQAISEVLRQNKELQTAGAQLDATNKAKETNKAVASEGRGEVKLLAQTEKTSTSAAASGDVSNGVADGGRTEKLENDLAVALETLDTSKLENEDLKKRLDALEEQIATLQRLVSLKDDQLASIQSMDLQKEALVEQSDAAVTTEEYSELADDSVVMGEVTEESLAGQSEEADFNFAEDTAEETAEQTAVDALDPVEPIAPEINSELTANQIQQNVEDRYKPKGFVAEVMAKPELIAGLTGGLVLLLGLIGFAIKKRRDKDEGEVTDPELTAFAGDNDVADVNGDVSLDNFEFDADDHTAGELSDELLEGIGSTDANEDESVENDDTVAQTADIIGEAEIYIAYGRFDQAADLLKNSIQLEPSRIDLRLKLLEVFVETDDATSFAEAELDLNSIGDIEADEKAIAMRKQLTSPIDGLEESNDFDALTAGLTEGSEFNTTAESDDAILGMEDLADSHDEFANGLEFEAALDLSDGNEETSAEDSESFAASLDAMEADTDSDFDVSDMDGETESAEEFDFELTSEEEILDIEQGDEIPTLENLDELDDVPTLSELDNEDALNEFADLSELDELGVEAPEEIPTLEELDDPQEVGLDSNLDIEIPTLAETAFDAAELNLSEIDTAAQAEEELAAPAEDLAELDALSASEAEDSDISELENLLDSQDSEIGGQELPDLSFDMEETGSASEELDDDLKSLEAELNDLSEPTSESIDQEEDKAEVIADLEQSFDLDELTSDFDEDEFSAEGFEANSDFDLNELDELPDFTSESAAQLQELDNADAAQEIDLEKLAAADDEFDFLAGTDECATKLDLARAYMDMEDNEGAKELLQEVISEGSDQQKHDARALMDSIG